jgi:hypothetical protein
MNITDEYIEVSKPGQRFGLIEIEALKMDSIFHYPSEEKIVRAMTLIKRRTGKQIGGDDYAKIIFGEKNKRFYWRVYKEPANEYLDSDTVLLKSKTWYRLTKETGVYNTYYFYWNGNKGDFIRKVKPNPGAW